MQVRSRMESDQGISFTEFTYQLLQVGGWVGVEWVGGWVGGCSARRVEGRVGEWVQCRHAQARLGFV